MFKIYDGREHFYQWDSDCKLIIDDDSVSAVHFCNRTSDYSIVCNVYKENGQYLVNVPNILFQNDRDIHVYAYDDSHTLYEETYKVYARSKPADYVYKDDEVLTWAKIEQRMTDLENTVSTEGIAQAVQDYLKKNPVEAGATQEQVNQINANTNAINDIKDNYAKKTDIPDVSGYLTEIPGEYVTETELEAKGYITTIPSNYVTEESLSSKGYLTSIPAEYVTETELNAKGYLTEHQSLAGYATTNDVATAVSDKVSTTQLDNAIAGFVTESQMNTAIENALATIVDGEAVQY